MEFDLPAGFTEDDPETKLSRRFLSEEAESIRPTRSSYGMKGATVYLTLAQLTEALRCLFGVKLVGTHDEPCEHYWVTRATVGEHCGAQLIALKLACPGCFPAKQDGKGFALGLLRRRPYLPDEMPE